MFKYTWKIWQTRKITTSLHEDKFLIILILIIPAIQSYQISKSNIWNAHYSQIYTLSLPEDLYFKYFLLHPCVWERICRALPKHHSSMRNQGLQLRRRITNHRRAGQHTCCSSRKWRPSPWSVLSAETSNICIKYPDWLEAWTSSCCDPDGKEFPNGCQGTCPVPAVATTASPPYCGSLGSVRLVLRKVVPVYAWNNTMHVCVLSGHVRLHICCGVCLSVYTCGSLWMDATAG